MAEVFNRFNKIKSNKKLLTILLVIVEFIGILVLIWYLRTPLIQKFLIQLPKRYDISTFDSQKTYVLSQADFLHGKSAFTSQGVIIRQGKKHIFSEKLVTGEDGTWNFRIPQDIKPGRYILTLGYIDSKNDIKISNYKLNIKSNVKNIPILSSLISSPSLRIENITPLAQTIKTDNTKSDYFRLLVNNDQSRVKQLEKGIMLNHISPQALSQNKPKPSSATTTFYLELLNDGGSPLQTGWLQLPIISTDPAKKEFEITVYNDNPNTKQIKLYDANRKFLWGNKI